MFRAGINEHIRVACLSTMRVLHGGNSVMVYLTDANYRKLNGPLRRAIDVAPNIVMIDGCYAIMPLPSGLDVMLSSCSYMRNWPDSITHKRVRQTASWELWKIATNTGRRRIMAAIKEIIDDL